MMDHPIDDSTDRGPSHCVPNLDGSCSICADEALLGTVLAVDAATDTAQVMLANGVSTVALDLISDVTAGDQVMVHLGFAIAQVTRVTRVTQVASNA